MNIDRIARAIEDMKRLEMATKWLSEYAGSIKPDLVDIKLSIQTAGACYGYKEAAEAIQAQIKLSIQDHISAAIRDCENTAEIWRSVIVEEAIKGPDGKPICSKIGGAK